MIDHETVFLAAAAIIKVIIYLILMWYAYKSRELMVGVLAFILIASNYFALSGLTFLWVVATSIAAPLLSWTLIKHMTRKK